MGGAGALVVGDEIPEWQDLDLQTLQVDLRIDGGPPVTNFEGDYRSNPLEVVVWLANFLSRRGIGLRKGDLVSTGSATHAPALYSGASAIATFGVSGRASVNDDLTRHCCTAFADSDDPKKDVDVRRSHSGIAAPHPSTMLRIK